MFAIMPDSVVASCGSPSQSLVFVPSRSTYASPKWLPPSGDCHIVAHDPADEDPRGEFTVNATVGWQLEIKAVRPSQGLSHNVQVRMAAPGIPSRHFLDINETEYMAQRPDLWQLYEGTAGRFSGDDGHWKINGHRAGAATDYRPEYTCAIRDWGVLVYTNPMTLIWLTVPDETPWKPEKFSAVRVGLESVSEGRVTLFAGDKVLREVALIGGTDLEFGRKDEMSLDQIRFDQTGALRILTSGTAKEARLTRAGQLVDLRPRRLEVFAVWQPWVTLSAFMVGLASVVKAVLGIWKEIAGAATARSERNRG